MSETRTIHQSLQYFIKTFPEKQSLMPDVIDCPTVQYFEVKVFCSLKNNYYTCRIKNNDAPLGEFALEMAKLTGQKKITKQDRGNYIDLFRQCMESKCQTRTIERENKVIPFSFRAVAAKVK